jgi:hypothetical protein
MLKVGKWDNGIRVGISEKMKVGANNSNEMLINLTHILLASHFLLQTLPVPIFPLSAICLRGSVFAFLHLQADAEYFTHQ